MTHTDTPTPAGSTLARYTVAAYHPDGQGYDVELIASSPEAASTMARGWMFHGQRDAAWLAPEARFVVVMAVAL